MALEREVDGGVDPTLALELLIPYQYRGGWCVSAGDMILPLPALAEQPPTLQWKASAPNTVGLKLRPSLLGVLAASPWRMAFRHLWNGQLGDLEDRILVPKERVGSHNIWDI